MDDANSGSLRVAWAIAVAAVLVMWVYAISAYPGLPERVATHFDLYGQPNGWGSKSTIFLLPAVSSLFLPLAFVLRRMPPNVPFAIAPENLERVLSISRTMVAWLMAVVFSGFAAMEVTIVRAAAASALPATFGVVVAAMLAGTFACVGIGLYRMYRAA